MLSISPTQNYSIQKSKQNFRANTPQMVYHHNHKKAEIQQKVMTGLQAGALVAIIASVFLMLKSQGGMGMKKKELQELWQDVSNSAKLDELALPKSLTNFTTKFKNAIKNPEVLLKRGGKPTKSVLLYGPPGTGKTTFAKAIAKEFPDARFAALDVTSLGSEYRSVSERNLNKAVDMICKEADKNPNKKFFVFIDEIDSVMMVDNSTSAKHSNDLLNEFKKCFTEKLGKRDNIITIGATNLEINVEKGITASGKKLDKAMLDRFEDKVLVDLPTSEQILNSIKHHYKDKAMVCDALKTDSNELKIISDFLSKKENNTSFRTLDSLYGSTASSIKNTENKVEIVDFLRTIKSKQAELNFTDAQFAKLISDLGIVL